jgi:hypothetical protein
MKHERKWRHIILLSLMLLAAGCRTKVQISPLQAPKPPEKELKRMGFAIQVGAFSVLSNAIRLTQSLNRKGLDAYYFVYESGLYKVQFGDFPSRKAAQKKAQSLVASKIIDEYYIVSPEEYAVVKKINYGTEYLRNEIVKRAKSFLGMRYSWGGSSLDEGFDCSGLTMAVYKLIGLDLPHSAKKQYRIGIAVKKNQVLKGDLVFFATSKGKKVSHVGIYIGDNKFVHAPGNNKLIRTDSLSNDYFIECYLGARTYF